MPPRDSLREYTERLRDDIWPPDGAAPHLNDDAASALMERVREQVRALRPVDDGQKWLRDQALTINENLLRDRWLMIGDQGRNVSAIMLVVLVSWVTLIFVGLRHQPAAQRDGGGLVPDLRGRDRRRDLPRSGNGPAGAGRPADLQLADPQRAGADELVAAGPLQGCRTS